MGEPDLPAPGRCQIHPDLVRLLFSIFYLRTWAVSRRQLEWRDFLWHNGESNLSHMTSVRYIPMWETSHHRTLRETGCSVFGCSFSISWGFGRTIMYSLNSFPAYWVLNGGPPAKTCRSHPSPLPLSGVLYVLQQVCGLWGSYRRAAKKKNCHILVPQGGLCQSDQWLSLPLSTRMPRPCFCSTITL